MKEYIKKIDELLNEVGLSKKEREIYIALLTLGRNTVANITKHTSVNRTTGYTILNQLAKMKLVNILGKKPKLEYEISSVDALIDYLKESIERKKKTLTKIEESLPEIKSLHYKQERPTVKYYEGIDGIKQVYEDTLKAKENIISMASYLDMHETLPDYFPKYYKRRAKKGIHITVMIPTSSFARRRRHLDREEERTTALLPYKKEYLFTPELDVYDNKTMIVSWKEKLGIIIESQEIADMFKVLFRLGWNRAKELDPDFEDFGYEGNL